MRLPATAALAAAALLAAAACDSVTSPDAGNLPSEVALATGLRLRVEAAPTAVARGDSLVLRVHVRNPTGAPIAVTSSCTALAMLGVVRADGQPSALPAGFGCGAAITAFTVGAGQTVTYENRLAVQAYGGGPVAPGVYVAQAYSNLPGDPRRGPGDVPLPNAEAAFEVR